MMSDLLTTREFSVLIGMQPDSVRSALFRNDGEQVHGVAPVRLENGRLGWPMSAVLRARDSAPRTRSPS
jgi:hypothetical protein